MIFPISSCDVGMNARNIGKHRQVFHRIGSDRYGTLRLSHRIASDQIGSNSNRIGSDRIEFESHCIASDPIKFDSNRIGSDRERSKFHCMGSYRPEQAHVLCAAACVANTGLWAYMNLGLGDKGSIVFAYS